MNDLKCGQIQTGNSITFIYTVDEEDIKVLQNAAKFYDLYKYALSNLKHIVELMEKIEEPKVP